MINSLVKAKEIHSSVVKWRRDLHQIPEVGLELPKTAAYVADRLKEMGIPYKMNVGVSGIVGLIEGKNKEKTIALRADMDALSIPEETGLPFASTNGNMHACGHDTHTAMLLGAAKILNDSKDDLNGNVKLIFQAAEEGPGGAKPMLDDGAFENPKVDAVLGLHIGSLTEDTIDGQITVCHDKMMACLDSFKIVIKGKGCHGAFPQNGVDPILIASNVISAIQSIVSRELAPTDPAVITVGIINGGFAYNIIPDTVVLEGTARALDQTVREYIAKRIGEIAKGVSEAMRGSCDYNYHFGYPPVVNDAEFTDQFIESAKRILPEEDIVEMKKPIMGGEDFAYYLNEVPGTFFYLGSLLPIDEICYPHHNSRFAINEDTMERGVALLVQGAYDWLEK